MLVVTTPTIEGKPIVQQIGPVSGQCITAAGALKSLISGIKDIPGARIIVLEDEVRHARDVAIKDMIRDAEKLGAKAIVGLSVSYASLAEGQLMLVAVSGTAVILEE